MRCSGKDTTCLYWRHKRHGFYPWVGKSPGVRNGNPLQYSCLENSTDRGAWWAIQSMGSQRFRHNWAHRQGHFIFNFLGNPEAFPQQLYCFIFSMSHAWEFQFLHILNKLFIFRFFFFFIIAILWVWSMTLWTVIFIFPWVLPFLPNVVWQCCERCTHKALLCVLENWPFSHYVMSLFISCDF